MAFPFAAVGFGAGALSKLFKGKGGGGFRMPKELRDAIWAELLRRITDPRGFSPEEIRDLRTQLTTDVNEQARLGRLKTEDVFAARGGGRSGLFGGGLADVERGRERLLSEGFRRIMLASLEAQRAEQQGALGAALGFGELSQGAEALSAQRQQGLLDLFSKAGGGIYDYLTRERTRRNRGTSSVPLYGGGGSTAYAPPGYGLPGQL